DDTLHPSALFDSLLPYFSNAIATTKHYTLSLTTLFRSVKIGRELLGCSGQAVVSVLGDVRREIRIETATAPGTVQRRLHEVADRSEEHTSELQSRGHLVCRLLLEKKKETRDGHSQHNHR